MLDAMKVDVKAEAQANGVGILAMATGTGKTRTALKIIDKMFEEDLNYKFKDKLPAGRTREAMTRLMTVCRELEADGSLIYENVMSR